MIKNIQDRFIKVLSEHYNDYRTMVRNDEQTPDNSKGNHLNFKKEEYRANNLIKIRKYHNPGAFLNIMQHKKKLLHAISIGFTLTITLFFLLTLCHKGNRVLKLGLALLLGGAFSNTYDRLSRNYVIDYFSFCTHW